MAIPLKSPGEIDAMARAGAILRGVLSAVAGAVSPGTTTRALEAVALREMEQAGAEPIMRGYRRGLVRPFPGAICASVNDRALHAPPDDRPLAAGDVLSVDVAIRLAGWCVDAATTIVVGPAGDDAIRLADAARACLHAAIERMTPGTRWRDAAQAAADAARAHGVGLVTGYDGHGIGRALHEPPRARLAGLTPTDDFVLRPGMVLTVEPVVTLGTPAVRTLDDEWTVVTADGRPAAHEERTVAVTRRSPRVLAGPDEC